jgi:hypothetical protein
MFLTVLIANLGLVDLLYCELVINFLYRELVIFVVNLLYCDLCGELVIELRICVINLLYCELVILVINLLYCEL